MAVSYYQQHRPREATITVSQDPDYSGDFVCDGAADEVEIQAAIDYVQALGGGIVFIQQGEYEIASTISLAGYITLKGTGVGFTGFATLLNLADGADCVLLDLKGEDAGVSRSVALKDIWFGGNATNQTGNFDLVDFTSLRTLGYIDHCYFQLASRDGLLVRSCVITNCRFMNNYRRGINAITDNYIAFNEFPSNAHHVDYDSANSGGIYSSTGNNHIISNSIYNSTFGSGITCFNASGDIIIGNRVSANNWTGIALTGATKSIVSNNTVYNNSQRGVGSVYGISLSGSSEIIITGNHCYDDQGTPTQDSGILVAGDSDDNIITENNCENNTDYGINILADTCERNLVKDNILTNNGTAPFNDAGTDTKLATKTFQFIQGTTFISAAGNPWGWEIDADTEFAIALGHLPLEVQMIVRIKIWAVGLVGPGVSPGYMRAQFTGEAAASDETYTTEPIDVVDKNCEEDNFAANDVIHWVLDVTDDADIGQILGGDSLQFKVLHEGGAGDDIETDAIFRCIEIEYV